MVEAWFKFENWTPMRFSCSSVEELFKLILNKRKENPEYGKIQWIIFE